MIYLLAKQILLPPASLILCCIAGLAVMRRRGDAAWRLAMAAMGALYLLSTPVVADSLLSSLEVYPPLGNRAIAADRVQAIVVLSAENEAAPEFGGSTVGPLTLVRLRYGAHLHALTHLPILVSGGLSPDTGTTLAGEMQAVLRREYGIGEVWIEDKSTTTRENAILSSAILKEKGITRIFLVTHAWHMLRAYEAFARTGLQVIAAPTAFTVVGDVTLLDFLPSGKAVLGSYYAAHELLGGLYYRLTGWLAAPAANRAPQRERTTALYSPAMARG